jgi:hypothetical protein
MDIFKQFAIIILGFLIAAPFAGFSLLRSYEEFRKGVEQKSKGRILLAFSLFAFLFMITVFSIVRGVL